MIDLHKEFDSPVLALQRVPRSDVNKYGIVDGVKVREGVFKISNLVEKPSISSAPSDMAIIGRYILTSDIFDTLEDVKPGKGGEIQLTDALFDLLKRRQIYGYLFGGTRYDAGDKVGYLKATVDLALKNPQVSAPFKEYLIGIAERLK
jgi:UTP--glucose-1-phosphate uridylyltransferase